MSARKLQQELNRKIPFASVQQEAVLNLLRTADQLENRLMRLFREHGLTLSQFNMLRVLQIEDRPMTCGEIGEQMIQVVPAITGLVDRLEQQGLVARDRCTKDRRVVFVKITKKGIALTKQAWAPLLELEKCKLKHLTQKEIKELIGLLEKTRESMAAEEPTV